MGRVLVAVWTACAGVICVDVVKRLVAVCTYAWASCRYIESREQGGGGVQGEVVML